MYSIKLLNEELTPGQEKALLNQFLQLLSENISGDNIATLLYNILLNLNERGQFHLQLVDRDDKTNDMSDAYGYYSAYENNIYLVVDKTNFASKWFGLATDYDTLNSVDLTRFKKTCVHEMMHYCCTNYYQAFLKIWYQPIRTYIWNVFTYLVENYFYDFVDRDTFNKYTPKQFLAHPNFKKGYETYYNSISINMRFRLKSSAKRYNDVLSNLYSKQDFLFARFIDNILVGAMKLREHMFNEQSFKIYIALKNSYIKMEPTLANIKMNIGFCQELLDFSEIPCVFATFYDSCPLHSKYIEETLKLI